MDRSTLSGILDPFIERLEKIDRDCITDLNAILDDLNAINYQTFSSDDNNCQVILYRLMNLLPKNNDHILSKFCHLVQSFARKLKVNLGDQLVNTLIVFLSNCGAWVQADVLLALTYILNRNVAKFQKTFCHLIAPRSVLVSLACDSNDVNVRYYALKCIQILTSKGSEDTCLSDDHLVHLCSVCTSILLSNIATTNNVINCKIILCSLKCIQNAFPLKNLPDASLGELLGVIKTLLYCGFPGQTVINPVPLYPTLMAVPPLQQCPLPEEWGNSSRKQFQRHKAHKVRSKKKTFGKSQNQEKQNFVNEDGDSDRASRNSYRAYSPSSFMKGNSSDMNTNWRISSSSSEFSDIEDNSAVKLKSLQVSVRQHAYIALHNIVRATEKKLMFGFWSSFLPDTVSTVSTGVGGLNIFTTILKDPSQQVRLCAVGVLTDLLKGSKQYLSLVDDRTRPSASFTTASSVVTSMVLEIHRCLLLTLISETSPPLLTQILKCYAVMVENIPYQKLNAELLTKFLKHLKPLLANKDLQVRVACLTVFGSILNSDQVPEEVSRQIMLPNNDISPEGLQNLDISEKTVQGAEASVAEDLSCNNNDPWIFVVCKNNITGETSLPIQVESLQVLAVIIGRYFNSIRHLISSLQDIIILCLENAHLYLELHGAKLLEVMGRGILSEINSQKEESSVDANCVLAFWVRLLSGPFSMCLMKDEQNTLRSVSCDCLSTIPPNVFEKLPEKCQVFCLTVLFGLSSDPDQNVRGAAIRCLGVFSLFACLREDLSFLSDVSRVLNEAVNDSAFIVRVKASWAMGNLTDALFLSREQYSEFSNSVTIPFIYSIGMASVHSAKDCDKIKASAVRALGNLLHFLPKNFLGDEQIKEFIVKAILALLAALSAKIMKVCWNACYALGNVLKSKDLVEARILDLNHILERLMAALSSSNFKVRTNAILALSLLPSRDYYGDLYTVVFQCLVDTLASAKADMDFKELKHFENLRDAICFSLSQMLVLIKVSDSIQLLELCLYAGEILLTSMWKFGQTTSEGKILIVCAASEHISSLMNENPESTNELEFFKEILNQAQNGFQEKCI